MIRYFTIFALLLVAGCQYNPFAHRFLTKEPTSEEVIGEYQLKEVYVDMVDPNLGDRIRAAKPTPTITLHRDGNATLVNFPFFEELDRTFDYISSDYESFCFAALEGMAMGLPVLTTDCAWVPRLVEDGAGMVVPVGNSEAFAAALCRLADNPALRQRMGATGRQQVLERHTWPASAEKLMELYRGLIC